MVASQSRTVQHRAVQSSSPVRQSQQTPALNLVLQAALGSLDVSLDEEMARYRRRRAGYPVPPPKGLSTFHPEHRSLDLIAIHSSPTSSSQSHASQVHSSQVKTKPVRPHPGVSHKLTRADQSGMAPKTLPPKLPLAQPQSVRPPASQPPVNQPPVKSASFSTKAANPSVSQPSSEYSRPPAPTKTTPAAKISSPTPLSYEPPPKVANLVDLSDEDSTSLPIAAIVKMDSQSDAETEADVQVDSLAQTVADSSNPYDYLESSEELLKSLSEEDLGLDEQPSLLANLFTPLGIGSTLVLLLSSATLGYLFTNPSSLQHLQLGRLLSRQSPIESGSSRDANSTSPGQAGVKSSLPNSPDLSSKEFVDLNLNSLSTLKTTSSLVPPSDGKPPTSAAQPSPLGLTGVTASTARSAGTGASKASTSTAAPAATSSARSAPVSAQQPYSEQPRATASSSARSAQPTTSRYTYTTPLPSQPVNRNPAPKPVIAPPPNSRPAAAPPVSYAKPSQPAPVTIAPPSITENNPTPSTQRNTTTTPYVVVTPYTGDRSLESAQQVVPDAYLKNSPDGAKVQLGSFDNPDKARQLADQLQQQGIDAQVHQP